MVIDVSYIIFGSEYFIYTITPLFSIHTKKKFLIILIIGTYSGLVLLIVTDY